MQSNNKQQSQLPRGAWYLNFGARHSVVYWIKETPFVTIWMTQTESLFIINFHRWDSNERLERSWSTLINTFTLSNWLSTNTGKNLFELDRIRTCWDTQLSIWCYCEFESMKVVWMVIPRQVQTLTKVWHYHVYGRLTFIMFIHSVQENQ